nr:hypothetical protein [Brevibacterium permense]
MQGSISHDLSGGAHLCEDVTVETEVRHRRALRGTLAAAFATFVALTSHILGGGAFPSAMGVVVPLALSILVCVLLSGRRLSLPRLTFSVGISQTLFHLLFSLFTPHGSASPNTVARSDNGLAALLGSHSHHSQAHGAHHAAMHSTPGGAMQMAHDSTVMPAMDGSVGAAAEMHSHSSPGMLLAHCVAGIVTIAMIYWAERLPVMLGDFARLIIFGRAPARGVLNGAPWWGVAAVVAAIGMFLSLVGISLVGFVVIDVLLGLREWRSERQSMTI